jgi:phosphoglucosamine mutase
MIQNLFGTDGIRTKVGSSPFTRSELIQLGHAIGQWAREHYKKKTIRIILAQDTRESGSFITTALATGLLPHSIDLINVGILPTPALFYVQQYYNADCGIMISASHNPYYDNGIKILDTSSSKLSTHAEEHITRLFFNSRPPDTYMQFGTLYHTTDAIDYYVHGIQKLFSKHFLQGKKIILDCAHGATTHTAPALFKALGAQVITLHNTPDGRNINNDCGSLHPQKLQQKVIEEQADAGFAFDGDGDRVTAISKNGEIKNGDDILALLSTHPRYKDELTIVGTIMSNQGLAKFLEQHNKKLVRTHVGDKHVAAHLHAENLLLGGEQSGHIILYNYLPIGDGVVTALHILQAIIATDNWHMNTFESFGQIIINIPIKQKKSLDDPLFKKIIAHHESLLDNGRILVRYSGTEPLLRVMVEEENKNNAHEVGTHLAHILEKQLRA